MAHLIISIAGREVDLFTLPATTVMIGRGANADLQLSNESVSREHLQVSFEAGDYVIQPLSDHAPTLLNDTLCSLPSSLAEGDVIQLGKYTITFTEKDVESTQSVKEPQSQADPFVSNTPTTMLSVKDVEKFKAQYHEREVKRQTERQKATKAGSKRALLIAILLIAGGIYGLLKLIDILR